MRLAIMGGTFNPVHIGHLVCAEEAAWQFGLDRVIFMPAGLPPHKEVAGGAGAEARYLMTAAATAGNPRFEVSRYEVEKQQTSYTVETIRHYRELMPDAELFFITGADAILEILEWKDPAELLQMAVLIAATRPGYSLERLPDTISAYIERRQVIVMEIPAIGISSSLLRERVAEGRSIRYLVPEGIEEFIEKEGLYRHQ